MNATRLWTLGSILMIVALIAGTWFVGISPRLTEASAANSERAAAETQNAVQAATLAALKKQFDSIDDLRDELSALRVAVPAGDATPELMRQLTALASATGVTLKNVTLSTPAAFVPPVEPSEDAELSSAMGSVSTENFLSIGLAVTVTGAHGAVMAFLAALQSNERAILISDFSFEDGLPGDGAETEVTFTGETFVLLDSGAVAPSAEAPADAGQTPVEGGATPQ